MEVGSVLQFLEDKTILVTGATGFLAKILAEKILRVQPNVKKLYLLLRATDDKAAAQRFHNEVIGTDLFRVLKEKMGANFIPFISQKVTVVPGDITCEDLGVNDSILRDEMCNQIDAVVNLAATTKFDERYDVSLRLNTLGAKHVVDFAKKCSKIKVLVHVSTAYVCGETGGLIEENPYRMGQTLNGATGLDIDAEVQVVEEKLNELTAGGATQQSITLAMRDFGIERAMKYGWPNTYVFTKAMGEMLIGTMKTSFPVVISRPTIVTSTWKEPFPGWVEGLRTIDSIAAGYGKGKLTCFLADLKGVVDLIPADMVVNSIMVAMAAHVKYHANAIYQIGSSVKNPMRYGDFKDYGFRYFTEHPCIGKDGKPIRVGDVPVFNNMESFHRYLTIRYLTVLKGLELANMALCQYFQRTYIDMNRKIKLALRLIELYKPYLFFKGIFDDMNTEKLRIAARDSGAEMDMFFFDPKCIDWEDYFLHAHFPGVVKHVFK